MGTTASHAAGGGRGHVSSHRTGHGHTITDKYETIAEVTAALRSAGVETAELIVGVDFTKSNEWNGKATFGGRCLHAIDSGGPNPYEMAIGVIGRTLAPLDADQLIPAYGFGDSTSTDRTVFSFLDGGAELRGFAGVQARYRELVPAVRLAGPTTFAPLIREAIQVVCRKRSYHILLILADGQVTRGSDVPAGELSDFERDTVDAIVEASRFPLSIVMVGIGDGPWEAMRHFDDNLPHRLFDNFQFCRLDSAQLGRAAGEAAVAATRGAAEYAAAAARLEAIEASFAVDALQEVADQWAEIQHHHLLSFRTAPRAGVPVLAPPRVAAAPAPSAAVPAYAAYGVVPPPAPAAAYAPSAPSAPSAPVDASSGGGSGGGDAGGWTCFACTLQNPGSAATCQACLTPRPAASPAMPPSAAAGAHGGGGGSGGGGGGGGLTRSATEAARLRAELDAAAAARRREEEERLCAVCLERNKNTAFTCGHQACGECAAVLTECHLCRAAVTARIKLF
mmetsp:Transcript_18395/g.65131  ORF Transcript_18395/g.65131 Transcript_18395/m.65131 type:complete len:508 (-) Transcript_18395:77-1600(-)